MAAIDQLLALVPGAIQEAQQRSVSAISVLAVKSGVAEDDVAAMVSARLGFRSLEAGELTQVQVRWDVISVSEAGERRCLSVETGSGNRAIVVDDPWNDDLITWLTTKLGRRPDLLLTAPSTLSKFLSDVAAVNGTVVISQVLTETVVARAAPERAQHAAAVDVVKFVHTAVAHGFASHASDIHFESTRGGLEVKLRLDGVLVDHVRLEDPIASAEVISRIKVLAELDIAEKRVPQDGRFSADMHGLDVDCRVSVMPSAHGEDAVIRILDKRHLTAHGEPLTLSLLGFDERVRASLHMLSRKPHGMLLVTGPTGSGKTTTLYAALSEIRTGREKIVTIEDPIEYDVPGVLQVPVNEKKGLTFARGLRSILRHDPDVIMVGEIRDRDTADIAIQSALTGHLVFTTVHANTALDVVSRFTHMGVDLYGLVSSLNGVLAQRLLRLNCSHCSQPDPGQLLELAKIAPDAKSDAETLKRGTGCTHCRGTGYRGRTAIGEVLMMDDTLRDMLVSRAPVGNIKQHVAGSVLSLQQAALNLVQRGLTTVDEVARVVDMG